MWYHIRITKIQKQTKQGGGEAMVYPTNLPRGEGGARGEHSGARAVE